MLLSDAYKPNSQKALFHKDIVNHIRKWIKNIEDLSEFKKPVQHLLYLSGPVGCGKTITCEVLLKGFNVTCIDPNEIRSHEKITEITSSLTSFSATTLANIEKWNHKNNKEKPNVILIDNIELCERWISAFVETVHASVNVPIILVSNVYKLKDAFTSHSNLTILQFTKPSLLEISKLVSDINVTEKLKLTKENIKQIVTTSNHDLRQVYFIIEQWNFSKSSSFEDFIQNVAIKFTDIDLHDKLEYLLVNNKPFDTNESFHLSSSEPITVSYGIFQNYVNVIDNCEQSCIDKLNVAASIIDSLSSSNLMNSKIFNEQLWEIYDAYTVEACVIASYFAKTIKSSNCPTLEPFKDISYNFINSLKEVQKKCIELNSNTKLPYTNIPDFHNQFDTSFTMAYIFIQEIKLVNAYFDNNKRGKNTSKQEKLDICNGITDSKVNESLEHIVQRIYNYKLFEVDLDHIILNRKSYEEDEKIQENVGKVDIRMFKRLLNIFTLDDSNKSLKSHVETAIKYKLLQTVVSNIAKSSHSKPKMENLIEDLDKIWNLG
jgi:DNA polymerase III delta prime subunit